MEMNLSLYAHEQAACLRTLESYLQHPDKRKAHCLGFTVINYWEIGKLLSHEVMSISLTLHSF